MPWRRWLHHAHETAAVARLVLCESTRSFARNRGLDGAATLAYYGAFSLMPLLLVLLIVTSRLTLSSGAALAGLESLLEQAFPRSADTILGDVRALSQQRGWGAVGIVLLLWSVTPFAAAIRGAFFRIFKTEPHLPFLKAKLLDAAAVLALLSLLLFLVAARVLYGVAQQSLLGHASALRPLAGAVVPLLVTVLVIAFFFRAFAPRHTDQTAVLAGALTTTALLFLIRPAFALLLRFNPEYGFAFGSMKAVFLVMVWVYYSFAVMLLGAEVMANCQRRDALLLRGLLAAPGPPDPDLHPLLRRFVADLKPGAALFREGDAGDLMYYVLSGAVDLTRGDEALCRMGPGDYFGEMSMLTGAPRTATAAAAAPGTRLIGISAENLEVILRENPAIVRAILVEMANRLRRTNEALERG